MTGDGPVLVSPRPSRHARRSRSSSRREPPRASSRPEARWRIGPRHPVPAGYARVRAGHLFTGRPSQDPRHLGRGPGTALPGLVAHTSQRHGVSTSGEYGARNEVATSGRLPTDRPQAQVSDIAYADYIRSPEWSATRSRFLRSRLFTGRCVVCGRRAPTFDVHHKTYRRLGHERLTDLQALCRRCHDRVHVVARMNPQFSLWYASQRLRRWDRAAVRNKLVLEQTGRVPPGFLLPRT